MKFKQELPADVKESLAFTFKATEMGRGVIGFLAEQQKWLLAAEGAANLCVLYASMAHLEDDKIRESNMVFHAVDSTLERFMLSQRFECLEHMRAEDEENALLYASHPPLFE